MHTDATALPAQALPAEALSAEAASLQASTPCLLGEGATWSAARGQLLWTDIQGQRLWALEPLSQRLESWPLPGRLGSFALSADPNQLLAAFEHHLAWLDLASGQCRALAEFDQGLATRANDGRCDRAGNFIFGTLDEVRRGAPTGNWYRYSAGGVLERLALPPVFIPNGLAFSANGQRLYFCDSTECAVRCADYDAATGRVSQPRIFATLAQGEPDGATVDADDHYWCAQWGAGRVQRYTPGGVAAERVRVAASQPSCLAFGGAALGTLFITSARQGLSPVALQSEPDAGRVFSLASAWRGLPEPLFGLASPAAAASLAAPA